MKSWLHLPVVGQTHPGRDQKSPRRLSRPERPSNLAGNARRTPSLLVVAPIVHRVGLPGEPRHSERLAAWPPTCTLPRAFHHARPLGRTRLAASSQRRLSGAGGQPGAQKPLPGRPWADKGSQALMACQTRYACLLTRAGAVLNISKQRRAYLPGPRRGGDG